MSYHIIGVLLNETLMIEYMDKVIMFVSDDECLSTLIIPIVMKSRRFSPLYLAFFSNLIFSPRIVMN